MTMQLLDMRNLTGAQLYNTPPPGRVRQPNDITTPAGGSPFNPNAAPPPGGSNWWQGNTYANSGMNFNAPGFTPGVARSGTASDGSVWNPDYKTSGNFVANNNYDIGTNQALDWLSGGTGIDASKMTPDQISQMMTGTLLRDGSHGLYQRDTIYTDPAAYVGAYGQQNAQPMLGSNASQNQRILGGIYGLLPQGQAGASVYNNLARSAGDPGNGAQSTGASNVLALNGSFNPNQAIAQALANGQTPEQVYASLNGQRGFENGEASMDVINATAQAMDQNGVHRLQPGEDNTLQQAALLGSGFEGMPGAQQRAIAQAQQDKANHTGLWNPSRPGNEWMNQQQPQQGAQTGTSGNPAAPGTPGTSAGGGGAVPGGGNNLGSSTAPNTFTEAPGNYTGGMTLANYFDPSYDFREQQGEKALGNTYGAAGDFLSGTALKGISDYGQNSASQEYAAANQRYMADKGFNYGVDNNDRNFAYNAANNDRNFAYQQDLNNQQIPWQQNMTLAQMGLGATGNQSLLATQLAQAIANNQLSAGQTGANATIGQGNNISGALSQALNQYLQQQYMGLLRPTSLTRN